MENNPLSPRVREILIGKAKRYQAKLEARRQALQQIAQEMGVRLSDRDFEQIEKLYPQLLKTGAHQRAVELYVDGH